MLMLTYGMLTNNDVMPLPAILLGSAVLPGFKWEMLRYANIVKTPDEFFTGILWEIDETTLADIDCREGYPFAYDRIQVEVIHQCQTKLAWVYLMTDSTRETLANTTPSDRYAETVTQGYAFSNLMTPEPINEYDPC